MKMVLVVDDDPLIAMALKVRLASLGYESVIAHDCEQAERYIARRRPQLVLTDITMPGCSGFDLVERLGAMECAAGIPIVYMTASMDPQLLRRINEAGAAGFLPKPYTPAELRTVVEKALAS